MKNLLLLGFIIPFLSFSQKVEIKGKVTDEHKDPVRDVHIYTSSKKSGTVTDSKGLFSIMLPSGTHKLFFSHLAYETKAVDIEAVPGKSIYLNITLKRKQENIEEVVISGKTRGENEGAVKINRKILEIVPVITPGVKSVLLSLPSVTQLDELSSQYLVRGGNYDENAVFINGIEVFRPYLTRSGRQEGLNIVNPDLIENLYFYAGGFPVSKGNKLSSVLDIRYRQPDENLYKFSAGLTGGQFSFFRHSNRIKALGGIRYLNNTLLVKSMEGDAEFRPSFADLSSLFIYETPGHFRYEWLTYISFTDYKFMPFSKQTNFGTFADSRSLFINYDGQEKDRFHSQFSALKTTFTPSHNRIFTWINSFYHSAEREYFDMLASYFIGEPNTDLSDDNYGDPINLTALGQQLEHARNDLDALIYKSFLKYKNKTSRKFTWETGISISFENIRDRINEYQVIDSAGFAILPPQSDFHPNEPYESDTFPVLPFMRIKSDRLNHLLKYGGYIQTETKFDWHKWKIEILAGILSEQWLIKNRTDNQTGFGTAVSPRLLIRLSPISDMRHHFRLNAGLYMQPPAYREFRDFEGNINVHVKAQKAWNFSLAHQFSFHLKKFPFKLSSEIYYRHLYDVNPFKIDNIRIRYAGKNNAVAYAYGAEMQIYAELLPETPSWLSISYMKTQENIEGRGFIPRPTDQRFKMALMFQDYVPGMPFLKMYLNNVFATGMPTGAPLYADPYQLQFRTRNYWRTDIGLYYELTANPRNKKINKHFKTFSVGVEIINTFDRRNSVSNLWIREIYSKKMMGVPNYMTGRIFNFKIKMSFI